MEIISFILVVLYGFSTLVFLIILSSIATTNSEDTKGKKIICLGISILGLLGAAIYTIKIFFHGGKSDYFLAVILLGIIAIVYLDEAFGWTKKRRKQNMERYIEKMLEHTSKKQ